MVAAGFCLGKVGKKMGLAGQSEWLVSRSESGCEYGRDMNYQKRAWRNELDTYTPREEAASVEAVGPVV